MQRAQNQGTEGKAIVSGLSGLVPAPPPRIRSCSACDRRLSEVRTSILIHGFPRTGQPGDWIVTLAAVTGYTPRNVDVTVHNQNGLRVFCRLYTDSTAAACRTQWSSLASRNFVQLVQIHRLTRSIYGPSH